MEPTTSIEGYRLPICDVDRQDRNFPGVSRMVLTDEEVLEGGTTEDPRKKDADE